MQYVAYQLTAHGKTVHAVLVAWLDKDNAVLILYDDLDVFKSGDTVQVNLKTLIMSEYHDTVHGVA